MPASDLIETAGGLLRSANPDVGDLTHYANGSSPSGERVPLGHQEVNLAAALAGDGDQNFFLHDGGGFVEPEKNGWEELGDRETLHGEGQIPGVYGRLPGPRARPWRHAA